MEEVITTECIWTIDDEGGYRYFTGCGYLFILSERYKLLKICPYCNKSILENLDDKE